MRLVEIDSSDYAPEQAPLVVAEGLSDAVADDEDFQAIVVMPSVAARPRGEQATRSVRLLKELRPGLRRHCTGLAFVADAATLAVRGRAEDAETRMWGCPATTVTSVEQAREWLTSRTGGASR